MKFSEYQNLRESFRRDPLFQGDTLLTEQEISEIVKYERLNEDDGINLSKMFTWAAILGAGYLTWAKIKNFRKTRKALKILPPLMSEEFNIKTKAALAIGMKKLEKDKLDKVKDANKVKKKKELIDQQIKNIEEKRDAAVENVKSQFTQAEEKYKDLSVKSSERIAMALRNVRLVGRENLANAELEYAQTAAQQEEASQKLESIKKAQTDFSKSFNDVLVKDKDAAGKEIQLKSLDNSSELEEAKTELDEWSASLEDLKDSATSVKADIAEYKKEKKHIDKIRNYIKK